MTQKSNFPANYPLTTEALNETWRRAMVEVRRKHALLTPEQLAYCESQAQVCRDLMAGMPPMNEQIMTEVKRWKAERENLQSKGSA